GSVDVGGDAVVRRADAELRAHALERLGIERPVDGRQHAAAQHRVAGEEKWQEEKARRGGARERADEAMAEPEKRRRGERVDQERHWPRATRRRANQYAPNRPTSTA